MTARVVALILAAGLACSQATPANTGDAGAGNDVGGPTNCLALRSCAAACADDACVDACLGAGTAAARELFLQLRTCTRGACPDPQDETCRCEAECVFPGACTDLQDACSEGTDDPVCVRCF